MVEAKNSFRKSLGSLIEVKSREAGRQLSYRRQHQLIGALTKRP